MTAQSRFAVWVLVGSILFVGNLHADDAGTVSFPQGGTPNPNPKWPATQGTNQFVDAKMSYSANAGYTITKVQIVQVRVLGMMNNELSHVDSTGNFNGTWAGSLVIANGGTYFIRIRMYTVTNNMMQPPVTLDSAAATIP